MEVAGSSDMLVNINQTARRHIQRDSNLHSRRLENIKFYKRRTDQYGITIYCITSQRGRETDYILHNSSFHLCKHSYKPKISVYMEIKKTSKN